MLLIHLHRLSYSNSEFQSENNFYSSVRLFGIGVQMDELVSYFQLQWMSIEIDSLFILLIWKNKFKLGDDYTCFINKMVLDFICLFVYLEFVSLSSPQPDNKSRKAQNAIKTATKQKQYLLLLLFISCENKKKMKFILLNSRKFTSCLCLKCTSIYIQKLTGQTGKLYTNSYLFILFASENHSKLKINVIRRYCFGKTMATMNRELHFDLMEMEKQSKMKILLEWERISISVYSFEFSSRTRTSSNNALGVLTLDVIAIFSLFSNAFQIQY